MADFMRVKYENPKMKQSQIANQLGLSSSTLQRYRNDINMVSHYRIHPNNTIKRIKKVKNTTFDNNLHRESDVKRPQMTSNDLKTTSNDKKTKSKNVLKAGSLNEEGFEINEHYLDKILKNNET